MKESIRFLIYVTLIYIAGYEGKNDDETHDAYFYCEVYKNYLKDMDLGEVKIPGDIIICQFAIYTDHISWSSKFLLPFTIMQNFDVH